MNRRGFLAVAASTAASTAASVAIPSLRPVLASGVQPRNFGWADLPQARAQFVRTQPRPFFRDYGSPLRGMGSNRVVLLWKALEAKQGQSFEPRKQTIGDCVAQASALCVDTLTAVQICIHKKRERWVAECSTEAIYAGSRIEIGEGKMGRFDGTVVVWAGEYVKKYGVLLRKNYNDIDLTNYNPKLARQWGAPGNGVPDELEVISASHPVKTISIVKTWKDACDLIANGYAIVLGSSVGFYQETDKDGFLHRNPRDPWHHSMLLWGIDTKSSRPAGCIANSWGTNWISGPEHRLGTPAGCFWTDAAVIDRMLREGDSIALSNYVGYPRQELDYKLW